MCSPSPAFTQVRRLAQSAAQLAAEKMQIPAMYSRVCQRRSRFRFLQAAPLWLRLRSKAQQEAAAVVDVSTVKKLMGDFQRQRESMIAQVLPADYELQGKSARAWVFTASGDLPSTLLELVKGIPLQSSVNTAAMMLVGDNLDGIKGMIHDIRPNSGA